MIEASRDRDSLSGSVRGSLCEELYASFCAAVDVVTTESGYAVSKTDVLPAVVAACVWIFECGRFLWLVIEPAVFCVVVRDKLSLVNDGATAAIDGDMYSSLYAKLLCANCSVVKLSVFLIEPVFDEFFHAPLFI